MTKTIPKFKSVEEESDFWDGQDLTEFMSGPQIKITARHTNRGVLPVRFSDKELSAIREIARERKIGMGRLLHGWISERLKAESQS